MLPDGNEAFWWAFVALLSYECLDREGAFGMRLVWSPGGWRCLFPLSALRIRGGFLQFHGPLDWFRVELAVNWLRVQCIEPEAESMTEGDGAGQMSARVASLLRLRFPILMLALSLLAMLPAVAWFAGVSNWLLLAIAMIYGSAAWLAWRLNQLGKAVPEIRTALRSLGLEIFFCPLFGLGALRKAAKLALPGVIVAYRGALAAGEWPRLGAEIAARLVPLEAYWSVGDSDVQRRWQSSLAAARTYYLETGDAAG